LRNGNGRGRSGTISAGRGGGATTVIELPVTRSFRRMAKVAFLVVSLVVFVLAATVLSHAMHPIIGIMLGALIGVAVGGTVALVVVAWPLLRVLWHWSVEITASVLLVYGWTWLMLSTSLLVSLLVVAVLAAPAVWPRSRRWLVAVVWCAIVRHRLRLCFSTFIRTPGLFAQGAPPLILWARPTPAGERVWLWLRAGLALSDLDGRLDQIATACWASEARVVRASESYAALIRIDISRRDPLKGHVDSPLPARVPDGIVIDTNPVGPPPGSLNLADVPDEAVEKTNGHRPRRPRPVPDPEPAASAPIEDDIDAYI
jgi:hypothetical protein